MPAARRRLLLPHAPSVLGVWAHPDDEAYLSAGLMLRAVRSGGRVACLHATLGEQGTEDRVGWPPERLAARRREELDRALGVLGVTEHTQLGLPDGRLGEEADEDVIRGIADLIRRVRPDLVVTFGPDGVTGHPDHRAVSRWTTAAWRQVGHGELLYAATTISFMARFAEVHERLGLAEAFHGVIDDDEVALTVALDQEELDVKRAVLAAHGSQTAALAEAMGERVYREWYAVETFRRPAVAPLSQPETDAD